MLGTATITRILASLGRDQQDWSAEYRSYAHSAWQEQPLLAALLPAALAHYPSRFVPAALDDTQLKKTGKRIPARGWHCDPLSPPCHTNLLWGWCALPASVPLHLHQRHDVNARAMPVRFLLAPSAQKPGKKATAVQQQHYREQQKQQNQS